MLGTGRRGKGGMGVGEEGDYIYICISIYLSIYIYVTTSMALALRWAAIESHFNVSLIVRDKISRQCPQTTTFWRERRAEAESNRGSSAYQPNALPLGQTSSPEFPSEFLLQLCGVLYLSPYLPKRYTRFCVSLLFISTIGSSAPIFLCIGYQRYGCCFS